MNVDAETWRAFRILAIEGETSIADYLGWLVRDELGRSRKRKRRPAQGADAVAGVASPAMAAADDETSRSVRLSEAKLLTQLPRPAPGGS